MGAGLGNRPRFPKRKGSQTRYHGREMNPNAAAIYQTAQPFLMIALPIVASIFIASWTQNKRFDDTNKRFDGTNDVIRQMRDDFNRRFDEIIKRLDRIETKLDNHEQRLTRVEERSSLIRQ